MTKSLTLPTTNKHFVNNRRLNLVYEKMKTKSCSNEDAAVTSNISAQTVQSFVEDGRG